MKKIKLYLLLLTFAVVQLNSMNQKKYFSEPKDFPMCPLSKEIFWLETSEKQLIGMNYREAKKHSLLSYYIARFGYANSKEFPLKIGSEDQLDILSSKNIYEFLWKIAEQQSEKQPQIITLDKKKFTSVLEMGKQLPELRLDVYIARFLQQINKDAHLSFVFNHMVSHNAFLINNYREKIFFNNRKFYWQEDKHKDQEKLYDQDGNLLLILKHPQFGRINNGLYFIPTHSGNTIMTCSYGGDIRIYNLETKKYVSFNGKNVENLEMSDDGHYIALRCSDKINTIQIYNIEDIGNIYIAAEIDHININDFIFSPDVLSLILWTHPDPNNNRAEITLCDLTNIATGKVDKRVLFAQETCQHVVFNSDNQHICILNAAPIYKQKNNKFKKVKGGIIAHITQGELSRFGNATKAYIFTDNSDLIMLEENRGAGGCHVPMITFYHKNGEKLFLPDSRENFSCVINGNYILEQKNQEAHLSDHNMGFIATLNSKKTKFKLESSRENALKGYINISALPEPLQHRFYCPLPSKSAINDLHRISDNITVPQLIFLQEICSQKRHPGQFLTINKDDKLVMQIFKSFDTQAQSFLQKELRLDIK